jgi:hypothetical protein
MDTWSKYSQLGIWGLWREFFSAAGAWHISLQFPGFVIVVDGQAGQVTDPESLDSGEVFSWDSGHGLSLSLYAGIDLPRPVADQWHLLLQYESANPDRRPTFCPFIASQDEWANEVNQLLAVPDQVLTLNGQPGVGKRTVLQGLSLLHAGRLAELEPQQLNHWVTPSGDIWIVPELAMLETDVQLRIQKSVARGARLWAATAYDVAMLRARKIIHSAFADLVAGRRVHFAPVARRSENEIRYFTAFWQAFYGQARVRQQANLEFLKHRTLSGTQLSVGSILEEGSGLRGVIAEFEKEAIRQAHARVGRSQHKIARLLKVSRGSLQHKLRKYQLESYASADADTEDEGAG